LIGAIGFDINAQDNSKDIPLHRALRNFNPHDGGDIKVLTYLLTQKTVNIHIKNNYGYTVFHTACERINKLPLDIFKVLIETHGADINIQNNNKNTPLHHALRTFNPNYGGDITVLTYLLTQKTVNIHIKNNSGSTLLHIACQFINYLPIDIFKVLIETLGFDVNAQDNSKDIPLHHAICSFNPNNRGDLTVLTYLLSREDVNANINGKWGYTLLHAACININRLPLVVLKLLIETMGVDVNAQDNNKDTPLHSALRLFNPHRGDATVLAYLINQKDINVNIKGKQGHNLLHLACISNLSPRHSSELKAECDTIWCQIVEIIAERCIQQVLDETTP
jgi:ankyrin repeat protein